MYRHKARTVISEASSSNNWHNSAISSITDQEALFWGRKLAYSTEIECHFRLHSTEVIGEGFALHHFDLSSDGD